MDNRARRDTARLPGAAERPGILSAPVCGRSNRIPEVLSTPDRSIRWLAFYGVTADEGFSATYDIVVLDDAFQGSIRRSVAAGAQVCGYLSLGEIRTSDRLLAVAGSRGSAAGESGLAGNPSRRRQTSSHGARSSSTGRFRR